MILLQYIFILVSLVMILIILAQFKKNSLRIGQALLWGLVWFALLVASVLVNQIAGLISVFGVTRPVDLIVYLAIVVLFIYCYKLNMRQEELSRQITELVRTRAIEKAKKKK